MLEPDAAISVVVVNWNRCELLGDCVRSLECQAGLWQKPEIIVVDNGSTDGSIDLLRTRFPHARLIANSTNRGFCAANNQGIAAASGELIALLNNDAVADANWLAALACVFRDRPEIGMAASKILIHSDPHRIDKAGHLIWLDGQNRGRGTGALDDARFGRIEQVLWPDGCAAMYRRSMLEQIGGFDEDFFAYADDAELGLRARIAGWECLYVPTAVVKHRRGATLGVANPDRLKLIERNRVLLAVKLFPMSLLWLNPYYYARRLWAGFLAAHAGVGEASLFPGWRGKVKIALALIGGDLAAIPLIPRMLRKRAALARLRKLSPRATRQLIVDNAISLEELSTQAALYSAELRRGIEAKID